MLNISISKNSGVQRQICTMLGVWEERPICRTTPSLFSCNM